MNAWAGHLASPLAQALVGGAPVLRGAGSGQRLPDLRQARLLRDRELDSPVGFYLPGNDYPIGS